MFTSDFRSIAAMILAVCPFAPLGAQESATGKDNIKTLVERLDKSRPRDVRLSALKQLEWSGQVKEALKAVPLLKQSCHEKDGGNPSSRPGRIGSNRVCAKLPCPVEVVEGLFDTEDPVPNSVSNYVGALGEFTPECLPLLIKGLASDDREIRSTVALPLSQSRRQGCQGLGRPKKDSP